MPREMSMLEEGQLHSRVSERHYSSQSKKEYTGELGKNLMES